MQQKYTGLIRMPQELTVSPLLSALDTLCPSGYAIALHIRFSTPTFLFQTYDRAWIDVYTRKGLVMQDPTVHWGFVNTGTETWENLKDSDDAGVLEQAAEFGLKYGFVLALENQESRSVASFAREDRNFTDEETNQIFRIMEKLHEVTLNAETLSKAEISALKTLSVTLTHAGSPTS